MEKEYCILKKSYYVIFPTKECVMRGQTRPMFMVSFNGGFHEGIGVGTDREGRFLTFHSDEECDEQVFLCNDDVYMACDYFADPLNPTQMELETFRMISGRLLAGWEEK